MTVIVRLKNDTIRATDAEGFAVDEDGYLTILVGGDASGIFAPSKWDYALNVEDETP